MLRTTKKLIPFLIFLILGLNACQKGGDHLASYSSDLGFGYQYDASENYCRTKTTENGFNQYCPEGRIEVGFFLSEVGDTPKSVLLEQIDQFPQLQYTQEEVEAIAPTEEEQHIVYLAEQEMLNDTTPLELPIYIAVLPFGENRFAMVSGYLYDVSFEEAFHLAFRVTALTLQPTGVQK